MLIYLLLIKKDEKNNIFLQKKVEVYAFNVLLDKKGDVYLDLKEDSIDNEIKFLFENANIYNYDDKEEKLIKLHVQNIKDIQVFNFGNGGEKYIILLDNSDKLYALIDTDVEKNANIELLTDDSLNKVTKFYNECDEDGCLVVAEALINGKNEKNISI